MQVPRLATPSMNQFVAEHLVGSRPVIVVGAMRDWDLGQFSPTALAAAFGSSFVPVYDDLFALQAVQPLNTYLRRYFNQTTDRRPGRYVRWYTRFRDVEFPWADEPFQALRTAWKWPDFLPRQGYLLPMTDAAIQVDERTRFPFQGLFISGRGVETRTHVDPLYSSAMLCQLYGTKEIVLQPPATDSSGGSTIADVLSPSEMVLFPRGWLHSARSLSDSVSLTWNFVHASDGETLVQALKSGTPIEHFETLQYFANGHARTRDEAALLFARQWRSRCQQAALIAHPAGSSIGCTQPRDGGRTDYGVLAGRTDALDVTDRHIGAT